jgi:hypothetical protein
LPRYVLITPARNEQDFLEGTIQSVISQTLRPVRWVIVSDGSTDRTDDIVRLCAVKHDWVELVRMPERKERNFAGKVIAFKAGLDRLKGLDFEVLGNLDADITFEPGYFEFLMGKFAENPRLGVGGTPFQENGVQYDYRFTSVEHVSGACQMFRKQCFEDIGGYTPIRGGGIDLVAVVSARMKGWETRSFLEKACEHHRKMGTATQSKLAFFFRGGGRDYRLGVHPLWQTLRAVYQMGRKPLFVGGIGLFTGYFWAMITRMEKSVPKDFARFRQKEQLERLKRRFRKVPSSGGGAKPEPSGAGVSGC